jgi:hypothetical protein
VPGHGINLQVPRSISGAITGPEAVQWKQAIREEMDAINEAQTLSEPVVLPEGARAVPLKFIFAKKLGEDGKIERFKARLVFNHSSKDETDENNYSPVVDRVSLRVFLATVAEMGWELCQADVKTAFLNAENPGREFVKLPVELVGSENERTRILLKALYGLQRAPKMWHQTFAAWAKTVGFKQSEQDPCLFLHSEGNKMLVIYVDDMLLAAKDVRLLKDLCLLVEGRFKSRILGEPKYFLGMNVHYGREQKVVVLSQQTYIGAIIDRYGLRTVLPRTLPMDPGMMMAGAITTENNWYPEYGSLVGALLFLAVCTRPDISFAVGILSKFVSRPQKQHWDAAVNLVGYLRGTPDVGVALGKIGDGMLCGYADSDWGNDVEDRKSVSGGIVYWGSSVVSWRSKKQNMVSLSTAEAESHALVDVAKELVVVGRVLKEIQDFCGVNVGVVPVIYTDNQPAMDAILHGKGRTKHYDLRIKYLAFGISEGLFEIEKVSSRDNVADVFTKVLRATRFRWLVGAVVCGVRNGANWTEPNSRGGVGEQIDTASGTKSRKMFLTYLTL